MPSSATKPGCRAVASSPSAPSRTPTIQDRRSSSFLRWWWGVAAGLSDRTRAIVTFALCGFANFSSIAIQMAVTGGLAPNQRPMIAKLGLRALLAGSLANLMSAALAGLMITA